MSQLPPAKNILICTLGPENVNIDAKEAFWGKCFKSRYASLGKREHTLFFYSESSHMEYGVQLFFFFFWVATRVKNHTNWRKKKGKTHTNRWQLRRGGLALNEKVSHKTWNCPCIQQSPSWGIGFLTTDVPKQALWPITIYQKAALCIFKPFFFF